MLDILLSHPTKAIAEISDEAKETLRQGGSVVLPFSDHLAFGTETGKMMIVNEKLAEPMPPELLRSRRRIAGSGNALRLCASLRARLEEQLELPLEIRETKEEAAAGAAKYAHSCLKSQP